MTAQLTPTAHTTDTLTAAIAAATAAATLLPAVQPLSVGAPAAAVPAGQFAGAAIARLDGDTGALAVLVGPELVAALADSPLGELDLAAAVQPALDAAASTLGTTAQAAVVVDPGLVDHDLGTSFTAVPLVAGGAQSAVLLVTTPPSAGRGDQPAAFGTGNGPAVMPRGIEMLHGVVMDVTVELGRTRMSVRELLALTPGAVLELDRAAGSPADLLVNGRLIARGEVVVVDEDFGLRVTEIVGNNAVAS